MSRLAFLSLVILAAGACGERTGAGGPDAARPSTGDAAGAGADPIVAPRAAWTWIDVPGSACDDGSPTGFAVNPGTGGDLVVYFEGGGACWDYSTCFVLNAATHGPVGRPQWEARAAQVNVGPFDRARATNPFRASTFVYVPYCTGDLHAGNNVATYTALDTRTFHHVGRANAELFLPRLTTTWPRPSRVVVSGTSAGGFGATLNYDLFRQAFPDAQMALVSDAGPLLQGEGIPAGVRNPWFANWKLGDVVDPLCPTCRTDLSGVYAALSTRYARDRLALLSALTDPVIGVYFMLAADQFEASLRATVRARFDPTANARAYLVAGTQHGFLPTTTTTTSAGTSLERWLDAMVTGGVWASVSP